MTEAVDGGGAGLTAGESVTVRVFCFDPSHDAAPRYETYEVPYAPRMRILDALEYINEERGADIACQWYCSVRRCGTCAMLVNGRPRLTCWEPVERTMTIEPLRNLPIVRDLVTDRGPYERALERLDPALTRGEPYTGFPEPLTDREMAGVNAVIECLECLCCYSACPVIARADLTFPGPAPLVVLARSALDPRDRRDLAGVLTAAQVAECRACHACEPVCPVEIPIVSAAVETLWRRAS